MATKRPITSGGPLEVQPPSEHLWNVHEVAEFLRKSPHAVYKMAERRQIPFLKIRSAIRFDPVTIRAWVSRHSVSPDPNPTW